MEVGKKKGRKEKHRDKESEWEMEEKFSVKPITCLLWLSKASYAWKFIQPITHILLLSNSNA